MNDRGFEGPTPTGAETSVSRFDPRELQALKSRDNSTNFYHVATIYAVMISTIAGSLLAFHFIEASTSHWLWYVPVGFIAVAIMGASQHQLGGVIHEGTHYILFADRKLNEIASDWLAAFPIFTSTYAFRLHHLAHHQFVNDPKRDPNFSQAKDSGHWLDFPLAHIDLLKGIARQLNPLGLAKYILARARYSALGVDSNPYADSREPGSPWSIRVGVLFTALVPATVIPLVALKMWTAAAVVHVVTFAATIAYYAIIPDAHYPKSKIDPVVSHRVTVCSRITFTALLFASLTAAEWASGGQPVWGFYGLFWILPLFTTFPLFMILREWLQHGNADRGRYTNSRIFLVNPVARYAVFPWGMDYHLPHHLFVTVPHFKLRRLHELLLRDTRYAEKAMIVEGWSRTRASGHPTIVDVLGPDYAPRHIEVHVDDGTLELADVNDKAGVAAEVQASRGSAT